MGCHEEVQTWTSTTMMEMFSGNFAPIEVVFGYFGAEARNVHNHFDGNGMYITSRLHLTRWFAKTQFF